MSSLDISGAAAKTSTASIPTPEDMYARAEAMVPMLRERAREDAANCNVRRETVEAYDEAGFQLMMMPKRWGGYEMSPRVGLEVGRILARGDLSVAWIHGIYSTHSYHLAMFSNEAQEEVWGTSPLARIVSPYAPEGQAEPVPGGGYKLSGHWHYSSGSAHSDWAMIGAFIMHEDLPPEYRVVLIPRSDYTINEVWDVTGLEATGSNELIVEDVFVPEYRTLPCDALDDLGRAERNGNPGWTYKVPYFQIGFRSLSTAPLGALEALCEAAMDLNKMRLSSIGGSAKKDPDAQLAIAAAVSGADEIRAVMSRNLDVMERLAQEGGVPTVEERLRYRYQSSYAAQRVFELATKVFQTVGSRSILAEYPFDMIYRNIIAARAHFANNDAEFGRAYGAVLLGAKLPPMDIRL
ncbi:acyl-CoA dehydrogenase family protein [Actibacterium sp. D379-3]